MAINMRHNYNFMWIGGSIHNEDISQQILCAKLITYKCIKGKCLKQGKVTEKKIELFNEKNPLSFRWLSNAKVPGTWRS